jgi:hypothetical protein
VDKSLDTHRHASAGGIFAKLLTVILTKVRIQYRYVADNLDGVRLDPDFHRDDEFGEEPMQSSRAA